MMNNYFELFDNPSVRTLSTVLQISFSAGILVYRTFRRVAGTIIIKVAIVISR